jgi:hypothetical protein
MQTKKGAVSCQDGLMQTFTSADPAVLAALQTYCCIHSHIKSCTLLHHLLSFLFSAACMLLHTK